jgi:release factor glutamine methyltransferase
VSLVQGDLFDALPDEVRGRIDLVVSNPPYIPDGTPVPPDVGAEPSIALFAGRDGTDILRRLADEAPSWVRAGGAIACEIGDPVQASVFGDGEVTSDHTGRARVVWIRR